MVLRAIATYNDQTIDIHTADVQAGEEHGDEEDKETPTPNPDDLSGKRSPLPRYSATMEDGEGSAPGSRTRYDSVGIGPPPPHRNTPLRTGSAFYSITPAPSELPNTFDESFGQAAEHHEEEGLMDGELVKREATEQLRVSEAGSDGSWWETWIDQLAKLFVPQWRTTVILMWMIWGSMSFCESARKGDETI